MASFWDNTGGMLAGAGAEFLLDKNASSEAEKRLRQAQGPLYNQTQALAGQSLGLAQGMDPQKFAADRFAQQQALVAPGNQAAMQDLERKLLARGMLGAASYTPVPGTVSTGAPMNPYIAAELAAQQGAKAQAAYGSMNEGQNYLNQLVNRSGALQGQAQGQQLTGMAARHKMPTQPNIMSSILKSGAGLLSTEKGRSQVGSAIKELPGAIRNLPAAASGMLGDIRQWFAPAPQYDIPYSSWLGVDE